MPKPAVCILLTRYYKWKRYQLNNYVLHRNSETELWHWPQAAEKSGRRIQKIHIKHNIPQNSRETGWNIPIQAPVFSSLHFVKPKHARTLKKLEMIRHLTHSHFLKMWKWTPEFSNVTDMDPCTEMKDWAIEFGFSKVWSCAGIVPARIMVKVSSVENDMLMRKVSRHGSGSRFQSACIDVFGAAFGTVIGDI